MIAAHTLGFHHVERGRASGLDVLVSHPLQQIPSRNRDLYEVLGLPKDATQEDIKKAYRKVRVWKQQEIRVVHPLSRPSVVDWNFLLCM